MTQCERILRHLQDYGSITQAEDIFELDGIRDNLLRLNDISKEEVKHIVDIFGSRGLQVVLFPRLGSEE